MVTEPMTLVEHDSAETPPERSHRRWRWAWLAGLSAVVVLVVGGVAVLMTANDDDAVSSDDAAAAIALVTAHNEAQNVADGDMMRATLTDDAVWLDNGNAAAAMTVEEYVSLVEGSGPVEQTFTGEPVVVRDRTESEDLRVSVPMSFDTGQGNSWDGAMVYTLHEVDGEWMIAQINRQSDE